ncbi:MAG TPA: histidine phosphatase family protein [Anaeromyxobacter sp.]
MDVFAVRHGETAWNVDGRVQGIADSPLTDRGVAQARAVAGRLAREPLDALYSSDLGRARDTALYVAAEARLEVRLDAGLRERAYGVLEGKTWEEIASDHPESARRLREDPDWVIPGGESLAQFRDRVTSTLERIVGQAGASAIAVVTHGGVLGILYRVAMDVPLGAPRTYTVVNAGVNHLRHAAGRWQLVRWGDQDHLGEAAAGDDREPSNRSPGRGAR